MTRTGVDRILKYAFDLAQTRPKKHLTSATKSNGISISMPYWDERVEAMAAQLPRRRGGQVPHRHPRRRTSCCTRTGSTSSSPPTCSATSSPTSGPACTGTIGIAPSANINPERTLPEPVRTRARLGPRHRRAGDRQPDRPDLVRARMMLEHLGEPAAAAAMLAAVEDCPGPRRRHPHPRHGRHRHHRDTRQSRRRRRHSSMNYAHVRRLRTWPSLTPSTPLAYPQVIARASTLLCVPQAGVFPGQRVSVQEFESP